MTMPRLKLHDRLKARPPLDLGFGAPVGPAHPATPTPGDTERDRMVAFFLKASADAYVALCEAEPDDQTAPEAPGVVR